jgi:hypothetical protein
MDAAFDASENYVLLREESSDFIIKGNLAHLRWDGRQAEAQALPKQAWKGIERNRRVAYLSRFEKRVFRHRHPTLRRRLRTIIQELIYVPARILTDSNQLKLDLGRDLFGRAAYL